MAPPVDLAHAAGESGFAAAALLEASARNVGILAMEMYFPSTYIEQSELGAVAKAGPAHSQLAVTSLTLAPAQSCFI